MIEVGMNASLLVDEWGIDEARKKDLANSQLMFRKKWAQSLN